MRSAFTAKSLTHFVPHTPEWFHALRACNPDGARATKRILTATHKSEVCSVCGDKPAKDYKVVGLQFSPTIGATVRLCDDCRRIGTKTQGESFAPL
jgi:hypothetical protein